MLLLLLCLLGIVLRFGLPECEGGLEEKACAMEFDPAGVGGETVKGIDSPMVRSFGCSLMVGKLILVASGGEPLLVGDAVRD